MSTATMRGCFVTGTDTEVGKTRVSAALLHWLGTQGLRGAGYKPVAAGTGVIDGERVNEDVRALRHASSVELTDSEVGACQFEAACAPHIAAALEGRSIERTVLLQGASTLAARADRVVVEGVGGFCVPLGPDFDSADLAVDLALPVVLVVGLRLGCINHALLSARAIEADGCTLAGWIGNRIDPDMARCDENIATLKDRLTAPCLSVLPHAPALAPSGFAEYMSAAADWIAQRGRRA